jgi:hypothetical protein
VTSGGWTTEQSALLLWLQGIWDGKYYIEDPCDHGGAWIAERVGSAGTVTAGTGQELRLMLSRDARDWNNEMYLKDRLGAGRRAPRG